MHTDFQTITTEARGDTLWITLNRPETLNSINLRLVNELDEVFERIEAGFDPAIRAIVITGAGRAFCAGGDLAEILDGNAAAKSDAGLFTAIARTMNRIENCKLPVVAAVNGVAVAGGLELALVCDLVVAAASARFGDGHANFGLLPGAGGSARLPRKIGINRAKYMMMSGRMFPASLLAEWGLVCAVTADEELRSFVDALTADLERKSSLGLSRMKELIDVGMQRTFGDALTAEQSMCALHDRSFDRNEGLAAFKAKRTPRFEGR